MKRHIAAILFILLATSVIRSADAATLVVTSVAGSVNGDTSSPAALIANPGPDGISLVEAIFAANNVPGPHTISFSPALAGQTINLANGMGINRDGVTIVGFNDAAGKPNITLDASAVTSPVFAVLASDFTLSRIRLVNLRGTFGVWVNAGVTGAYTTPSESRNITIDGNEFSNANVATSTAIPITLGTDSSSSGARLLNVIIARNTFTHYRIAIGASGGDGVHIHAGGQGSLIQNVLIQGNSFSDINYPVELVGDSGANNRIVGTQIFNNTFVNSDAAINLNMISNGTLTGNSIEDTVIAQNQIHYCPLAIMMIAGLFNAIGNSILNTQILNNLITDNTEGDGFGIIKLFGGFTGANQNRIDGIQIRKNIFQRNKGPAVAAHGGNNNSSGNTIQNLDIVNNLIAGNTSDGGISLIAGINASNQNHLQNVSVINNTIANNGGNAFFAMQEAGGTGNVLANVVIANTIFWNNGVDVAGVSPAQVFSSILNPAGFAGTNGNIAADPGFVNALSGDFHLSSGSPAINGGTSTGAPSDDLECRPRVAPPDMGAYELGGASAGCSALSPTYLLTVARAGSGTGAVISSAMGINCGTTCAVQARSGNLTATPSAGSVLAGWTGCDSTFALTCTVNVLAGPRTVTAIFNPSSATVPDAPAIGAALVGNGQASIVFTPPANDGGSAIAAYTATCNAGAASGSGISSPIVIAGLNNYVLYTCSVTATNAAGTSMASATAPVIPVPANLPPPFTSPNAATFTLGLPGSFTVTTSVPSPVLSIAAGTLPAGLTFTPATGVLTGTPAAVGLYPLTFRISVGTEPFANQAFTLFVQIALNVISFSGPANQSFSSTPILLTAAATSGLPVSFSISGTPTICAISGSSALTMLAAGTCTIVANQNGNADYGDAPPVTRSFVIAPVAPDPPTIGITITGSGQATLAFTPSPNSGGSPVADYTATCNPGAITASGPRSPITVTGLVNTTTYQCTVAANNIAGSSQPSGAVSITPPFANVLALIGVQSRKTHGAAGSFDLPVDRTVLVNGPVSVEPRVSGTGHTIVFQFNGTITSPGTVIAADSASASIGTTVAISANEVLVTLAGIADKRRVDISLTNVNATLDARAAIGFLVGDVNSTRSVDRFDASAVKAHAGQTTTATNFHYDLNVSGSVSAADIAAVKARATLALP